MKATLRFATALLALAPVIPGTPTHAAERLDRGLIALPSADGKVYLGWRLLTDDPKDVAFHVGRANGPQGPWRRLTPAPIQDSCNFVDADADGKP